MDYSLQAHMLAESTEREIRHFQQAVGGVSAANDKSENSKAA